MLRYVPLSDLEEDGPGSAAATHSNECDPGGCLLHVVFIVENLTVLTMLQRSACDRRGENVLCRINLCRISSVFLCPDKRDLPPLKRSRILSVTPYITESVPV